MNKEQLSELKQDLVIKEGEEEPIEEEIEGGAEGTQSPPIIKHKSSSSNPATTKDSSDKESRNRKEDQYATFADEHIEYSESFKKRENVKKVLILAAATSQENSLDPSGSNSQTFGRRSRAQKAEESGGRQEEYEDDF